MASEQQLIYECSRKTADKQISNSEWINIFRDGIHLNRGDTVRLLGSFISEDGDSSDIQVLDNTSFTMEYTPYINVDTVKFEDSISGTKSHPAEYQMRFGDIGSPAYSTDAFGIEPPYYALNGDPKGQNNNHTFEEQLREPISDGFSDWYSTTGWEGMISGGETTPIQRNKGYDYAVNDKALKVGAYFNTSSGTPKTPITISTSDSPAQTYKVPNPTDKTLSDFTLKNLEHQYQIAHMCKLIYFPVFQGVYADDGIGSGTKSVIHTFGDDDYLQVGDYISTYFISSNPKHNEDQSTSSYAYSNGTFGQVQWDSGPRSVVGKILATRKSFVQVPDPLTNLTVSMELQGVYVYECVNPGSYKNVNDETRYPRHGSSEFENGYNKNRNDNRNSGVSYAAYPKGAVGATTPGPSSSVGYPFNLAQNPLNYEVQQVGAEVYAQTNCPLNLNQNINESMNLETNTSLSFFWSCRGTDMRPLGPDSPSITTGTQKHASSWIFPQTTIGANTDITIANAVSIGTTVVDIYNPTNKIRPESIIVFPSSSLTVKEVYDFGTYTRLVTYTATTEAAIVGQVIILQPNEGGIYWYPRQYNVEITNFDSNPNRRWKYVKEPFVNYTNWGAIVKTNPENDNVETYTPTGSNQHRLYIPFTQQIAESDYKVRNFGSGDSFFYVQPTGERGVTIGGAENYAGQPNDSPNTVGHRRLRQNFGLSAGRGKGIQTDGHYGDCINTDTGSKPTPYLLTDAYGWGHEFQYTTDQIETFLNQDQGNAYNDAVCSIHFQQPLTGSQEFKQATGNDPIVAKIWQEDLIYVKRYKTEFKPTSGYFNYQQVADDINIQLHYNYEDYIKNVGTNTTVGLRQRAKGVSPNVINGNFVHTYLPDLTYGFIPLTEELYTGSATQWNTNGVNTYRTQYVNDYMTTNLFNVNDVANTGINDDSIQLYFLPFSHTSGGTEIPEDETLQLFKLNGAKLIPISNTNSMDHQDPQAMLTNRVPDILNTMTIDGGGAEMRKFIAGVNYQTRTAFNNFMYGGCAKCFVGAVNPSFEIDPDISRMIFKFLYTPYRPATDDTGTPLSLVSGQAVPSAIIDSFGDGGITDSLSGIYIRDLISPQITQAYAPIDFLGYKTVNDYPTVDAEYEPKEVIFWNSLGFNNTQLGEFKNNSPQLPFVFWSREFILNSILYNLAELDISVNASNPFYSYCSLWLPPLQYSVEVDSNEIIAARQPLTQNSPFYLIGSDFPGKHYYGNKGTKLPVMGVCSRQFTSFGFAFDLSESAIQWTIEEDTMITSIHTKIYNNDMTIPLNLDDNSSIIYAITKSQYYKEPSEEDLQNVEKIMLDNTLPQIEYNPKMFYYQNEINYDAPFYGEDSDYEDD